MRRSKTSITGAVARTVIVFDGLFGITIGCTAICGMRMMLLTSEASSVASACEMKNTRSTSSSYC